MKPSIMYC